MLLFDGMLAMSVWIDNLILGCSSLASVTLYTIHAYYVYHLYYLEYPTISLRVNLIG